MLIRLLRVHLRPYRKPLAFLLVLQLAQTLATLYLPTLNADIIDNGVIFHNTHYILVTGGWMLAKGALIATTHLADDTDKWWRTRIGLARLYAESILAGAPALAAAVMIGANDLAATSPQALGHLG